ncbi:triggering receptor expressed on myeloid cells 1 [Patagioenas fasciata]|uniref:triggering receptor expressed on myeloid cells 1 n=1 Tax=Patagioenas fasciata TaxID=372321 RepID=UPI0032E8EBB1
MREGSLFNSARRAAPGNARSLGLRMAMELRALLLLSLYFPGLQAQTPLSEERQPEGSNLYFQCPYTAQVNYQRTKAWCRWRDGQCELLVDTTYSTQNATTKRATRGKVMIEDNSTKRIVTITITNLQVKDSGTYSCAYYTNRYEYVLLKTISLIVFKELHKCELDSLSVQCPYSTTVGGTPVYTTDIKAWCRLDQTECNILGRTDGPSTQNHRKAQQGRVLIQDDTRKRTVTITMQKLRAQDTGVYWCALYTITHLIPILEVKLSVSKKTRRYTAKESGNVTVQCTYSITDYRAVTKAWCKQSAGNRCNVLVNTEWWPSGYLSPPQQGRVTIQDDTSSGVVTITMEELQIKDSGVYWCALYEYPDLSRMVEVTLNISEGTTQTTPAGNSPEPSSNANSFVLLAGVLSVLFLLVLIGSITLWVRRHKQLKRKGTRQAEDIYDKPEDIYDNPEDIAQLDSTDRMESPQDDSKDLKYVTLNFESRLSPEDPLYCNVQPSQAHRKPEDEHVEYATIALKELLTNDKG